VSDVLDKYCQSVIILNLLFELFLSYHLGSMCLL